MTCFCKLWYMLMPVSLSNFNPVSLYTFKCSSEHTLLCLSVYCSFANIGHDFIICSIFPSKCWHSLHLLFAVFLFHDILFVTQDLVLLFLHFLFLILNLPSLISYLSRLLIHTMISQFLRSVLIWPFLFVGLNFLCRCSHLIRLILLQQLLLS